MKALKAHVVRLDDDLVRGFVDRSEGNRPACEVRYQLDVQTAGLYNVTIVGRHRDCQLALSYAVSDGTLNIEMVKVKPGLNVELQTELLDILNVVLLILAGYQLKVIPLLKRKSILRLAFDFDVGLGLFGAFDRDEVWTTLLIVRAFLVDLIPKTLVCRVSWQRKLVDLINLHRCELIEFFRPLDEFELWLGLEHEDCLSIGDAEGFLSHAYRDLIRSLVAVFPTSYLDHRLTMFLVNY